MKLQEVACGSDSGPGVDSVGTTIRNLGNGVESEDNGSVGRKDDVSEAEIRGASSLLKMKESGRNENLGKLDNDVTTKETVVVNGMSSCDGNFTQEVVTDNVEEKDEVLDNNEDGPTDEIVTINVPIADMSENKDVEEDDLGEVGFEFSVGDFVWGKVKSHPWWPGLIYDPSDASDYAINLKHKNRLLVAYFGDGTFAWCHPSQLKPFEDNFEEMSKQSNSKSFLNAVQNAVDDIARLVKVKISCSCLPEQSMVSLSWPFAENAGIKERVLVPGGGIEKFLNALPEPAGFLSELQSVARTTSFSSLLDLGIIESQLTAFYCSKGFYPLPIYHESQPISGLEDDLEPISVDRDKFSSTVHNHMQGPSEEDWLPSPKFGETDKSVLHECQGITGSRLHQRRKQKSIAEIMDADTENKEGSIDTDVNVHELVRFSGRRKRKLVAAAESQYVDLTPTDGKVRKTKQVDNLSSFNIVKDSGVKNDGSESKGKSEKRERKRKGVINSANDGKDQDVKETETFNGGSGISGSESKGKREKRGRRRRKGVINSGNDGKDQDVKETETLNGGSGISGSESKGKSGKRGRKRKEVINSGNDGKDQDVKETETLNGGSGISGSESKEKGEKRGRKSKGVVNFGNDGKDQDVKETETLDGGSGISGGLTNEQNGKSCLSRERKKSKYLSPPFTNISRGQMKRDKEDSKELQLAEGMTKTASHCADSSPILKSTPDTFHAEPSEEVDLEHYKLEGLNPQIPNENENKTVDPINVGASVEEVLVRVRSVAVDPLYPLQTKPFEIVVNFMAALRSCIYHHGSNYKMYNHRRPGRRRKNRGPEQVLGSMDQNPTANSVIEKHKIKRKNIMPDELKSSETPETLASYRPKKKRTEPASDKNSGAKESKKKDSPAALFVTFGPGSSLPSRADLIKIYSKFGVLNEMETDIFASNYCARVTFLRSSDAEEAFSRSQIVRPFGDNNVKFMLRYSSPASETHGSIELSHPKVSRGLKSKKPPAMQSSVGEGEASQLQFIRKKLESISSMLENSNGKVSPDLKSKLQGEMKNLLEEVNTMVGSSSSS